MLAHWLKLSAEIVEELPSPLPESIVRAIATEVAAAIDPTPPTSPVVPHSPVITPASSAAAASTSSTDSPDSVKVDQI